MQGQDAASPYSPSNQSTYAECRPEWANLEDDITNVVLLLLSSLYPETQPHGGIGLGSIRVLHCLSFTGLCVSVCRKLSQLLSLNPFMKSFFLAT